MPPPTSSEPAPGTPGNHQAPATPPPPPLDPFPGATLDPAAPPPRPQRGHFVRPTPQAQSVADALRAFQKETGEPAPDFPGQAALPMDEKEAEEMLRAYCKVVKARLETVKQILEDFDLAGDLSPISDSEFRTFIRNELSYLAGVFITTGSYPADRMPTDAESDLDHPTNIARRQGLDPAFAHNSAVMGALEDGFDFNAPDE